MTASAAHKTDQPDEQKGLLSRLRSAILSLELSPGAPISERELEQEYAVSRTPIREALLHLLRDGLVIRSGRSYVIAPFDMVELDEMFAFRDIIEPEAMRMAAERATPEEIADIRKFINFSHSEYTPERWLESGLDFHVRCAALSGNRFLVNALHDVTMRSLRARWLSFSSESCRSQTHQEHSEILNRIAAGDGEGAAKAALSHSAIVRQKAITAINNARPLMGRRSVV